MKRRLFLFFLACLPFLLFSVENLVKNGNFEDGAVGWYLPVGAEVARGYGFNANVGLKLTRTADMKYDFVKQPVALVPGRVYTLLVQMRNEDTAPGTPKIGVEYEDGKGTWLGGIYRGGPKDFRDWNWVELNVTVPESAKKCLVVLYIPKNSYGTVCFDNVSLTEAQKTPDLQFVYPVQGILDAESPVVRLNVALMGNAQGDDAFDGMGVELLVVDSQGGERLLRESIEGHLAEFRLPPLPEGETRFRATLLGSDGKVVGEPREKSFNARKHTGAVYPKGSCFIDEYGRAIVDGEPFLPIGLYTIKLEDLDRIADSDYNCVLPYGSWSLSLEKGTPGGDADALQRALDALQERNMKIVFCLKDFYDLPRYQKLVGGVRDALGVQTTRELWETLVNRVKDHPALLAWYNNDEIPLADQDKATEMREFLNEKDPNHPVFSVLCDFLEVPFFGPSCDIMGVDPYPIGQGKVSHQQRTVDAVDAAQASGQPFWAIPQLFNWGVFSAKTLEEYRTWNQPRPSQMRGVILLEALRGARGFIGYSYYDLKFGYENPDRFGGVAVQTEEDYWWHWGEVKELGTMLKNLSPWLLSKQGPTPLPLELKAGRAEAAIFRTDDTGKPAVLVASIGPDNVDATLRLSPDLPPMKSTYGNAHEVEPGVWHFSGNDIWGEILVPRD